MVKGAVLPFSIHFCRHRIFPLNFQIWKEIPMSCIKDCDAKDYSGYTAEFTIPRRDSVFRAYIPEIEDSTNVQFYAVAQDSRLANEFGGGFIVTGYGLSLIHI